MDPKKLTPEEEAVLDAVILQYGDSWGDDFEYDYMKAQKYLTEKGFFAKYKINLYKHFEILEELSRKNIINISDCIVTSTSPKKEIRWLTLAQWAAECAETVLECGPGSVDASQCCIFIRMSIDDVNNIERNYKASYTVKLKLNEKCLCLSIKIDQEKWKNLPPLHDNKEPFRILQYAYKKHDKVITRDELAKQGINAKKKYLRSQEFSDNNTVLALSPLFIELDKDSIMFKTGPVRLTISELDELKNALKIS